MSIQNRAATPPALLATLLFVLLVLSTGYPAQAQPLPDAGTHAAEFEDIDGQLPLGTHTFIAHLPATLRDAWLEDPRVLLETDTGQLNWHRNGADRLWLDAPSRLSLLVVDLVYHGERERDVMVNLSGIDGLGWFYRDPQGELISHFDDFDLPRGGRPVADVRSPLPLHLVPGHSYRLHIAAYTVTEEKYASIALQDAEAFRYDRLVQHVVDGAYYGLVFMVLVYNVFLAIALRRSVYLYLALFLAGSAALIYVASGMSQVIGLQNPFPQSLVLVYLFQGVVAVAGAFFSMRLLDIRRQNGLLYYLWHAVIAMYCLLTPVMLYIGRDGGYSGNPIGITFDLFALLWLLNQSAYLLTLALYWNRSRMVRYWYLGVTLHTWTLTLWPVLVNTALDPPFNPYHIAQLATVLNAILLSAVLAHELRGEQKARLRAQQQSVQHLRTAHDIDRARATFVDTMAHDLQGPLQTIRLVAHSLQPSLPRDRDGDLETINDSLNSLTDLISSMTRLSRAEWETATLSLQSVPLQGILEQLRRDFTPAAVAKGLSLQVDHAEAAVLTDRVCLVQILRNLIDNAIKYTSQGTIRVRIEEHGTEVKISVEDTGRGITGENLEQIFSPFFQSASGDSTGPGVGLGLSIVDRLVKRLEIPLDVESSPGKGSRFRITLRRSHTTDATGKEPVTILSLSNLYVLALQHESGTMEPVITRLIDWGATIWPASTVAEATMHCQRAHRNPDLVLLDADAFQTLYEGGDIPVDDIPWQACTTTFVVANDHGRAGAASEGCANVFVVPGNVSPMQLRSLVQRYVAPALVQGDPA